MANGECLIQVEYEDYMAIITLNRPKKLNAFDGTHFHKLAQTLREIATRKDVHITILTGRGRFFSAGYDVTFPWPHPESPNARCKILQLFAVYNLDLTRALYTHPKILVAGLNGPAVGLSAALVAHADFIYAAPHAYLLAPFSSIGFVPEAASSKVFVDRLGFSKAMEALIMSKKISSEVLVSTGFVNKILTPHDKKDNSDGFLNLLLKEVRESLGRYPRESLLETKKLIQGPRVAVLDAQNVSEVFAGTERFMSGVPQKEFQKLACGAKKHKL